MEFLVERANETVGETSNVTTIIQTETAAEQATIPEDIHRFYSTYVADDYVITIVHDITLGDVLISTLLCVLIIANVLGRVIGGVRR